MKFWPRKFGAFTLVELLVVLAIIAMLIGITLPAARMLKASFESTGAEYMISSALSTARSIAAKEHRYAGVRFQKICDPNKAFLDRPQYMVFIVYDMDATKLASGFRAVDGIKPVKLPDSITVIEAIGGDPSYFTDANDATLTNRTSFSVLFSPTGKLIIHDVRVSNRDGLRDPSTSSYDQVFNTRPNVVTGVGSFIQDDYSAYGLVEESSVSNFIIFDNTKFKTINPINRWTAYLKNTHAFPPTTLPIMVYINPYTGTMIEK